MLKFSYKSSLFFFIILTSLLKTILTQLSDVDKNIIKENATNYLNNKELSNKPLKTTLKAVEILNILDKID